MRRPQKPFSVEVKRGKKSAASGFPMLLSKQPEPVAPTLAEAKFSAPPAAEPPKPQRRILQAIEPEPVRVHSVVEPLDFAAEPAPADPMKRRRGRPPKQPARPAP